MSTFVTIKGLPELKALFARVPDDVSKKTLRRGASAGARVVKAAEIAAAPVRENIVGRRGSKKRPPGTLKAAAITKFARDQSTLDQAVFLVTFRQGKRAAKGKTNRDAFYAKFVERGHKIVPRSRRIGTYRGRGLYAVPIRVRRAAASRMVPPHRFFGPAFSGAASRALEAMVRRMGDDLKKALA